MKFWRVKHEIQGGERRNKKKKWPPAAGHMKGLKHHCESQGIGNGQPLMRFQKGIRGVHAHIYTTIFFITSNIY
jgi:hypothetical protein